MVKLRALAVFFLFCNLLRAASPVLLVDNQRLPSPVPLGCQSMEGFVWRGNELLLCWSVPSSGSHPLRYALFDASSNSWSQIAVPENLCPPASSALKEPSARLVHKNGRHAKVWTSLSGSEPGVFFSLKPDAQTPFLMPVRIDDGHPCGDPDLALLDDGTAVVSWPEHYAAGETALWLRRISPGGDQSVPVLIAVTPKDSSRPHLALLQESGGQSARLLLAYRTGAGDTSQVFLHRLDLAPANEAPRRNPCHTCPDTAGSARGHALRGTVVSFSREQETLSLRHEAVEGVIGQGITEFRAAPEVFAQVEAGGEVFVRIEKREGVWWLFSASWVKRASP